MITRNPGTMSLTRITAWSKSGPLVRRIQRKIRLLHQL